MRDNELDNQIDDAARRLTAGEPGGDLRARVLARIDGASPDQYVASGFPSTSLRARSRTRWIVIPAALAAAVAIAVVATRPQHDVQPTHEVRQVHEVQNVQGVQEVQQVQVLAERPTNPVNHVNRVNVVNPVTSAIEIESPFAPAPIDIAPLTIDAIPPAQTIVVADLSVSPIEVRAIDEIVVPDLLAQ